MQHPGILKQGDPWHWPSWVRWVNPAWIGAQASVADCFGVPYSQEEVFEMNFRNSWLLLKTKEDSGFLPASTGKAIRDCKWPVLGYSQSGWSGDNLSGIPAWSWLPQTLSYSSSRCWTVSPKKLPWIFVCIFCVSMVSFLRSKCPEEHWRLCVIFT